MYEGAIIELIDIDEKYEDEFGSTFFGLTRKGNMFTLITLSPIDILSIAFVLTVDLSLFGPSHQQKRATVKFKIIFLHI